MLAAIPLGLAATTVFFIGETRTPSPMLPLRIFRSRQFSGANGATLLIYASLSGALFFVVLQLQSGLGYSALEAGAALAPITFLLLVLSPPAGRLASRIGSRLPMTVGPLVAAVGIAMAAGVTPGAGYVGVVLPSMTVFGLGLGITVAPLTTAALTALRQRHAGLASGVNNAVARVAGLLAVAVLPFAAGIGGIEAAGSPEFTAGFEKAMWISAGLLVGGGLISWLTISKDPEPV